MHFQNITILHIELILTSSESTRQLLHMSLIFMYTHEGTYFIKINKLCHRHAGEFDILQFHVLTGV
jgi:hypothetical protein